MAEPRTFDLATTLLLRGVASFIGGCGFAVLYNASWRTVLTVGVLAVAGNELRLSEGWAKRTDALCCPTFEKLSFYRYVPARDRYVRYHTELRRNRTS